MRRKADRSLILNFTLTSFFQALNLLIPLALTPYLVKVLGVDLFGRVGLGQTVMSLLAIIVDYGFSITAVREIAQNRDDRERINVIVSNVCLVKCLLVLTILPFLLIFSFFLEQAGAGDIFLWSYLMLIGQALNPIWFFQGIEDLKLFTVINSSIKVLFVGLIFLVVRKTGDAKYVNGLLGTSTILMSGLLWIYLRSKYRLRLYLPEKKEAREFVREGWHIFSSSFTISLYIQAGAIILNVFSTETWVGYYLAVEKITTAIRQILVVFYQVTFPRASSMFKERNGELVGFYKRYFYPFLLSIVSICLCIFFFSHEIVCFIFDHFVVEANLILRVLCVTPILVCMNVPYNHWIIICGKPNDFSRIVFVGLVVCLMSNLLLVPQFDGLGTAIATVVTESVILILMIWNVERTNKAGFLYSQLKML